jgi:acetylornithine deacetylase
MSVTLKKTTQCSASECDLVIDIRVNDCYSNPEILEVVKEHVDAEVTPLLMHIFYP